MYVLLINVYLLDTGTLELSIKLRAVDKKDQNDVYNNFILSSITYFKIVIKRFTNFSPGYTTGNKATPCISKTGYYV